MKPEKPAAPRADVEAWYLDAVESAPFGILIFDNDDNILFFNRYLENVTGYTRDAIPDLQTWMEKIYPDLSYRRTMMSERFRAKAAKALRVREAVITTKGGQKCLCRFSAVTAASLIRTVFVQPMVGRHAAQAESIEGDTNLQFHVHSVQTPLIVWRIQQKHIFLSAYNWATEKLTSGKISDYQDKSIRKFLPNAAQAADAIHKCVKQKASIECAGPFQLPGSDADSNIDCIFIYLRPDFVVMHLRNHTELTRIKKSLQESERRYQDLVDMLPISIFEIDRQGNVTFSNPKGFELFGFTQKDLAKGVSAIDMLVEKDRPRVRSNIMRVLDGQKLGVTEYTVRAKSGRKIQVVQRSVRIMKSGEVVGLRVGAIDVSKLKKTEKALKKAYTEMETKVADRTRELVEVNTALRVLLRDQQTHQKEIEEHIRLNANDLIMPHLDKLQKSRLSARQQTWLRQAVASLHNITSPLCRALSNQFEKLTPTELQIADLIKNGKSSKEIADILNMATRTVESHRKNIRRKLGLQNKKINLRTYLLSF